MQPGTLRFRPSGEFNRQGKPLTAPLVTATIHRRLAVMRYQVTSADSRRCVEAQACSTAEQETAADCGVRVVEGRHRTYMTDFVRDARAGGCSGGTPLSLYTIVGEVWGHRLNDEIHEGRRDVEKELLR